MPFDGHVGCPQGPDEGGPGPVGPDLPMKGGEGERVGSLVRCDAGLIGVEKGGGGPVAELTS